MGIKTSIEWCDSTVNPTSGCQGCELWNKGAGVRACYAGQIHEWFAPSPSYPGPFEVVSLHPGRMARAAHWPDLTGRRRPGKPWLNGLPRHIFVGDMGDVFSRGVSSLFLDRDVIRIVSSEAGQRHQWMILTKQVGRLVAYANYWRTCWGRNGLWPSNLLPGASVTSEATVGRARTIAEAFERHYFLSVEPLLTAVDLRPAFDVRPPRLVIVGGESGPKARPLDLDWVRTVIATCRRYAVPCFVKQLGSAWARSADAVNAKGGDPWEWPEDLRVRDPFPAPSSWVGTGPSVSS